MKKVLHSILLILITSIFPVFGQTGSGGTLESLIKELHRRHNILVAYHEDMLKVTVNDFELEWSTFDLESTLADLFSDTDIHYMIIDENKLLLRKKSTGDDSNLDTDWVYIEGRVEDMETKEALPYASIFVPGTGNGTISDEFGRFSLKCRRNHTSQIVISYLGYENGQIDFNKSNHTTQLKRTSYSIDEVVVILAPLVIQNPHDLHINLDHFVLFRLPQTDMFGKDPIRSIQMLPGIAAGNDESGIFKIRGAHPDEVLILMDGIPVYKVDHYYGIFNAVNPFVFDRFTLYKNKVPLQYESRTGGMLLLESGERFEPVTGHIEGDFMKVGGGIQTSPNKYVNLIVGGRFNHTDPFNTPLSMLPEDVGNSTGLIDPVGFQRSQLSTVLPSFSFYDLNGKLTIKPHDSHTISLSTFQSRDKFQRSFKNVFISRQENRLLEHEENFLNGENWSNTGYNIHYSYVGKNNNFLNVNHYYSSFTHHHLMSASLNMRVREREQEPFSLFQENNNQITGRGVNIQYFRDNDYNVGFGVVMRSNGAYFNERLRFKDFKDARNIGLDQDLGEYYSHASKTWVFKDRFFISGGLKLMHTPILEQSNFSPSMEFSYTDHKHFLIKSSYVRLFQNIREVNFESRTGQNMTFFLLADGDHAIQQGRSDIFMVGGEKRWNSFTFDVEFYRVQSIGTIAYLPQLPGVSVNALQTNSPQFYRFHTGISHSQGADILVSFETKRLYSMIGYTLSKTMTSFEDVFRGEFFPSPNDRRHQLKMVNTLNLGPITLSSNVVYQSGMPFTSLEMIRENTTRNTIDIDNMIGRLPYYFRADISLQYDLKWNKSGMYCRLSLYNLTNRENIRNLQQTYFIPFQNNNAVNDVLLGFNAPLISRMVNISSGFYF
ncbi:MAG TPA: TonB-dependent receptor [Saprospiraceae bacterium]|nr:TonB-dependent receptor [Saprospiraceae bacterium]